VVDDHDARRETCRARRATSWAGRPGIALRPLRPGRTRRPGRDVDGHGARRRLRGATECLRREKTRAPCEPEASRDQRDV